jgi:RNA recognition motif. (a.k.a. RRM, RBD, or RNP domain)
MKRILSLALSLLKIVSAFVPLNNRIFVGGNFGTIDNLVNLFRAYGRIEEVRLQEDDIAFVTFVDPKSAVAAVQHSHPELIIELSVVAPNLDVGKDVHTLESWEKIMSIAHQSNFAIQVSAKHLDAMRHFCCNHLEGSSFAGELWSVSNLVSMVFLKVSDHDDVVEQLNNSKVYYNGFYPLLKKMVRGTPLDIANQFWMDVQQDPVTSSIQPSLLNVVHTLIEEFRSSTDLAKISSKDCRHIYSVVRLAKHGSDDRGDVFLVGLSERKYLPNSKLHF